MFSCFCWLGAVPSAGGGERVRGGGDVDGS